MKKVTIVGAGNVGSQAAMFIGMKNLANITLIDIVDGIPQGKALDINESMPLFNSDSKITGTNNYADTKNSDIVVITAGLARKPGMTREDLIKINAKIVTQVTNNIIKHSKNPIIIMVTNPLDIMTYLTYKVSKLQNNRVIGMAGVLDSTRFTSFLAEDGKTSVKDIKAMVIGSHGTGMTVLTKNSTIKNKPLNQILKKQQTEKIIERVKGAGLEIVNFLKTGSAYYAPGAAIAKMVENILTDNNEILPCTSYLNGQYGTKDIFLGVPTKLGKDGVKEIVELKLSEDEEKEFQTNIKNVKKQNEILTI